MAEKKKIKVKVKKRKLKVKKLIITILILLLILLALFGLSKLKIKNIYIIGDNILSDKEIITMANLDSYPSFLLTTKKDIITKLEKNDYIKEVKVKKEFYNKVYIYITYNKILCEKDNNLILESGKLVENTKNLSSYPILLNDISSVNDKFIKSFSKLDDSILLKISEIEYSPNNVDNERFIIYMNDGNMVYITLSKIDKLNMYNSIYSKLDGKKGIIYLDLGDYVEIK